MTVGMDLSLREFRVGGEGESEMDDHFTGAKTVLAVDERGHHWVVADVNQWLGDAECVAKLFSAAQDLYEALSDEISDIARLAGPCQKGVRERCICESCCRERSLAALEKARAK